MLSPKIAEALNAQLNAEYYSSYLYLSMAADCEAKNLRGFSHWLRLQAREEMDHAMKIFEFVLQRGGRVDLGPIEAPPTSWDSALALFEATLKHERHITGRIHKLVDLAVAEADHATNHFLGWFVAEQVEEEASVEGIVHQLRLIGEAPGALFMLDRALAQRS